jgi:hypothetical protein
MSDALLRRPEANPFLFGLANLLGCGGAGYFWMGQRRKAYITWAVVLVGGPCTLGTLYVFAFASAYDAYLLGQRLQQGEAISPTQNGLPLFDRLFG